MESCGMYEPLSLEVHYDEITAQQWSVYCCHGELPLELLAINALCN